MAQDAAFQKRIQRIGEIVEQLERTADPNARAMGKELLESVMALHGAALEQILEFASNTGEAGREVVRKCANDELVSSVLLLYGLHPEGLHSRVTRALEKSRTYLESHSATAELLSVGDDGSVSVRLHINASGGCGSSSAAVKPTLEAALQDSAPDATSILVEEIGGANQGIAFVPIAALSMAKPSGTSSAGAARLHGTCD
jgi:Fe-S cluster biogenesis protein NfuA